MLKLPLGVIVWDECTCSYKRLRAREWTVLKVDGNGQGKTENAEWAQSHFHTSCFLVNMICL